ncbi:pre-rRNA-processing protein pno1 [Tulasnella sp. 427]|nr:pre-rRNA-processing protein pno1 [Tulasnella sp. 427]
MVVITRKHDGASTETTRAKLGSAADAKSRRAKLLNVPRSKNEDGLSRDLLMRSRDDGEEDNEDEDDSQSEDDDGDDELMIDVAPTTILESDAIDADKPPAMFAPLEETDSSSSKRKTEMRSIPIPPHRMSPLRKEWVNIFTPLTEMLGLQVRMNPFRKCVEMRTSKFTKEVGAIQKGADYVKAFALGFKIPDAIALLRMDDLYLDSFEIKDVKALHGDHLARAIGRIAGHQGKTRFTIENATRTRIILADTKIHIMGSFQNIKLAKDAIVNLILGSPPGKVYASLRTVSARLKQRAI